jgi:hypothetical protein
MYCTTLTRQGDDLQGVDTDDVVSEAGIQGLTVARPCQRDAMDGDRLLAGAFGEVGGLDFLNQHLGIHIHNPQQNK